jgi:hypothetical protein
VPCDPLVPCDPPCEPVVPVSPALCANAAPPIASGAITAAAFNHSSIVRFIVTSRPRSTRLATKTLHAPFRACREPRRRAPYS